MSALVTAVAFFVGAVPVANLAARWTRRVDLRSHGSGTVSASGLYAVAGFVPVAVAGVVDIAKGAVGPLLSGGHDGYGAIATAATLIGHNWSPFLRGAGGRGLAPALGATLVLAPEGTAVLAAGLALGRLFRHTGLGTFVAVVALTPVLVISRGTAGMWLGLAATGPILLKRVLGNTPLPRPGRNAAFSRLVFDRDPPTGKEATG